MAQNLRCDGIVLNHLNQKLLIIVKENMRFYLNALKFLQDFIVKLLKQSHNAMLIIPHSKRA